LGDEEWECEKCTFINKPSEACCGACYTPRLQLKDVAAVWEWEAEEGHWIAFDLPAAQEIEEAFQKRSESVALSRGFFAGKRGYEVRFGAGPAHGKNMFQVNRGTGNRRRVRRIADDDQRLFQKVDRKSLDSTQRCVICQEDFGAEADAAADPNVAPVKLPKCDNHYFHRGCIAPWVKLKNFCPYCRKPV
jgi:hypothetical protein